VAGRFPLYTDENIDGPIIRGLRLRGWDVLHAAEELGERTKDPPLFEHVASVGRVLVSTDKDMLPMATTWLAEGRPFRLIWWDQKETQRILVSVVLDAFEAIAAKDYAFASSIEYLQLPK
jgi:predicted nuclease of predicted toxin-antitoxin system